MLGLHASCSDISNRPYGKDGGDTPLMLAAWQGHIDCCAFLGEQRAEARFVQEYLGFHLTVRILITGYYWRVIVPKK